MQKQYQITCLKTKSLRLLYNNNLISNNYTIYGYMFRVFLNIAITDCS
jgi:hypothetical protein